MDEIIYSRGEGQPLTFTILIGGEAPDLTGATFSFVVKRRFTDTSYEIEKVDGDFNKSQVDEGIVSVPITTADTDIEPAIYVGQLKIVITASTDVPLSKVWSFEITKSVF